MSTPYYILGIAILCSSCGDSGEKKISLEQTRAAIEVRDAWRDELKPVEIVAEGSINGADKIGVRLTSDGETAIHQFLGNGTYKPEKPSLTADTASVVSACWPPSNSDTLSLTAPFSDLIYGKETEREVDGRLSFTIRFQSSMALLRFCIQSDTLGDILNSLTLKGDAIITKATYMPYGGKWIETSGEGMSVVIASDCLLNNGRNHDFFLLPCDVASDIVLVATVNGKGHLLKTKIPPLTAGSMTQLNLTVGNNGSLTPKSSWVDNDRKTDLRRIASVDTVRVGNYLRRDGYVVAKRDTICVAVVYETNGKHGKAVAIDDIPGTFTFGSKNLTSNVVLATIDGKRNEGVVNGSASSDDERLIYKTDMPYPETTAFGFKSGAELTTKLLSSKTGKEEGSMLTAVEKQHCSYVPSLAELTEIYYRFQPYANSNLSSLIEPMTGEYITSSESSDHNFYGIDMEKGVIMSNYSKQYAKLKLRLFYLF